MINWGIIGLGYIAGRFAESLKNLPNAKLFAVSSRSQEKAAGAAEEGRACREAYPAGGVILSRFSSPPSTENHAFRTTRHAYSPRNRARAQFTHRPRQSLCVSTVILYSIFKRMTSENNFSIEVSPIGNICRMSCAILICVL